MWQVKTVSIEFQMFVEGRFYLYNTETNEYYLDGRTVKLWNDRNEAVSKANLLNGVKFSTLKIGDMFYHNGNKYVKVPTYTFAGIVGDAIYNVFKWTDREQWQPINCVMNKDAFVIPCSKEQ